jgi:DNA-binding transcriptional LysR family regulator
MDQGFDWNLLRAFLATSEAGSLSGAARVLGLTQPTLSRQIAALEQASGLMLFERVGRGLQLTQAGQNMLEDTRAMGQAADRVALVASGQSDSVEGRVRITASDVMAAYVLPPALKRLRQIAPRLEIDVVAANDIRDLMRREADIAVRHVRPDQPDLIARLVAQAQARFYGAPTYLAQRGRPMSVDDLSQHDFVSFADPDETIAYLKPLGIHLTRENFRIGSDNGIVAWELVRQGFGLSIMATDVASANPGVELVLPDLPPVEFPVWLTTHRELHTSRRIRIVFDTLAEFLSAKPRRPPQEP